jgi:Zn finger protein HypA/HybF involved in hydrogenase expression
MHEVSLVQALFDQADLAIPPHPSADVRQVTVQIGAFAGVECALFRSAFEGCKADRGSANAALELIEVPAGDQLILQRLELETRHV